MSDVLSFLLFIVMPTCSHDTIWNLSVVADCSALVLLKGCNKELQGHFQREKEVCLGGKGHFKGGG